MTVGAEGVVSTQTDAQMLDYDNSHHNWDDVACGVVGDRQYDLYVTSPWGGSVVFGLSEWSYTLTVIQAPAVGADCLAIGPLVFGPVELQPAGVLVP